MTAPGPSQPTSTYSSRFLHRFGVFALASSVMLLPFVLSAKEPTGYVGYVVLRAVATISAFGATVLLVFDWMVQRRAANGQSGTPNRSEDADI